MSNVFFKDRDPIVQASDFGKGNLALGLWGS